MILHCSSELKRRPADQCKAANRGRDFKTIGVVSMDTQNGEGIMNLRIPNWSYALLVMTLAGPMFVSTKYPECIQSHRLAQANESLSQEPRLDGLGDPLPDQAIYGFGTKRFMHAGIVTQAIYSHDGKTIITYGNSQLIAWDRETGKQIRSQTLLSEFSAASYGVRPLAIVPDSGHIAVAHLRGLAIWNWKQGKLEDFAKGVAGNSMSIDFSTDGLCLAGGKNSLSVMDSKGKLLYRKPNQGPARGIEQDLNPEDRLRLGGDFSYGRFSPDNKHLALVNSANPTTIQLLVPGTGAPVRAIKSSKPVVRMDFSPNGKTIVASERDNAVRLYDVKTGDRVWELIIENPTAGESYTSDIAFRPDGKQIAVGAPIGSDHRIRLLDADSGKEMGSLSGSGWKPWTVSYSSDGTTVLGSGWDSMVREWDVATQTEKSLPNNATRASAACGISPDGMHLAFAGKGGIHLIELATQKTVRKIPVAVNVEEAGQIVFSDDGRKLAMGFSSLDDVHVKVFQVDTGQELNHFQWPKGLSPHSNTEAVCFSKDGKRMGASVFRQGTVKVFDLETNQTINVMKHPNVYGLDINFDGSKAVTAGWDEHVRIWDCDTGLPLNELHLAESDNKNGGRKLDTRMYGVKFSPDEKLIATCDMTRSVRLFDPDLRPIKHIKNGGWFTYGAINFSRNGLWIGVGAGRGNVRKKGSLTVFDVASGEEVWVAMEKHKDYVYTVEFGARDRSLLSGSAEGMCYVWDTQPSVGGEDLAKLNLLDEKQNKTEFMKLVGFNGPQAYSLQAKYRSNPMVACEIIKRNLMQTSAVDGSEAVIKKWIVALGSNQPSIIAKAKRNLNLLGPAVCDQLAAQLEKGASSDKKKVAVASLLHSIYYNYRRATILLAELESDQVDEALEELLANSQSKRMQDLLIEAQAHRAKFLRIGVR